MTAARYQEWEWQNDAACGEATAHLFYGNYLDRRDSDRYRVGAAKAICWKCPVRLLCLDAAMRNDEKHGIWGGLTEAERRTVTALTPGPYRLGQGVAAVAGCGIDYLTRWAQPQVLHASKMRDTSDNYPDASEMRQENSSES